MSCGFVFRTEHMHPPAAVWLKSYSLNKKGHPLKHPQCITEVV